MIRFLRGWTIAPVLLLTFSCLDNSDLIQPDEVEKWETINTSDGLAGNETYSLLETSDNRIWIGTVYNGVSIYNGTSFENYDTSDGLTDNTILSMTEWGDFVVLGTLDGLNFFDGSNWSTLSAAQFGAWTLNVYSLLGDSDGNLWFGTDDGLWRDDNTTTTDLYDFDCWDCNWVNVLFEDSKGRVWAGTDGGLKLFNGNDYTLWDSSDGLKSDLVYSIYEDDKGNIYFGYYDSAYITRFDGNQFESFYLWNDFATQVIMPVSQIRQTKEGLFWIGMETTQVENFGIPTTGLMESDTRYFRGVNTENSEISGNNITDILRDRNGDMWISTFNNGVSKYITK